jgi:hypothetical protein
MSELKSGVMRRTPHNEGMVFDRGSSRISVTEDETEFYLKSEVDEVIRHQKYKRCLAMAEQCKESLRLMRTYEVTDNYWNLEPGHDAEYFCKKGDFYSRCRKRWLKIAEMKEKTK